MEHFGIAIAGTGSYVPEKVLTNADLERQVETSDEWIRSRTGIQERHIAAPDEPTSALAAKAGERALAAAGVAAAELDAIIVATFTPDGAIPNTACLVQRRLGANKALCFSMEAACSGFIYGLEVAGNLIRSGGCRNILLVGAEKISSVVDWTDRNTCVLFGDGAGAALLQRADAGHDSLLATQLGADGSYAELLQVPAGGSALPLTAELLAQHMNCIKMEGREVFKLAVNAMVGASQAAMAKAGITHDDLRWVIPHQANLRIISSVGKYLEVPEEKVYVNVHKYGNTSAASIPIALDELVRSGQVRKGDHLLLTAFGAGLTWGAALLKW
ncbi:MAG: beta-ketoacyl-ACP synthase III [Lentisphaeria bacterium]|jgi:3-oxoacyl-[acyl-carrier-protein] synthase-3